MNRYSLSHNTTITDLCQWVNIPKSVFYYQPGIGRPGAKPSTHTYKISGEQVTNEFIVDEIKQILSREFANWGYEITAGILKREYIINEKKVYRLMDENNLLLSKSIKTTGPRTFVKFRTVEASYPMEYLSMDIKYVWVHGEKRNYYLLSVIDVYSKRLLHHTLKASIRKKDVIDFLKTLGNKIEIKGVIIRNDNGPQFIANLVKNFLRLAEVRQEFSHPATPEENCYIEAFHSILENAVIQRFEFESYYDAKTIIDRFIEEYNNYRPHRSIGMITPMQKWDQGMVESSAVKQQNMRAMLSRPDSEGLCKESARYSLDNIQGKYLCLTDELSKAVIFDQNNLNQNEKIVQEYGG